MVQLRPIGQHPFRRPPQPHRHPPPSTVAVDGTRVLVAELEAVDRTPIVDVKPVL